ncbi:hypothetical protein [Spiroplasma ixodetis]|uniref:hypothetical protein n=1 Tax=Spiroplasma ixodetis TaxID=2141 RepID=UPI002492162D|nr:hypothetical protein [Spiroplasma ixodetis]
MGRSPLIKYALITIPIIISKIVKVSATKLFFYSNIRLVKDNLLFFWVFGLKTI